MAGGDDARLLQRARGGPRGLVEPELGEESAEALAVLCAVDGIGRRAQDRHAGLAQGHGQLEGRLAAELDDHPERPFVLDDVEDVLEGEGLEVEAIGRVVVGGDRLRVAVDHDGLDPEVAQGEGGVHAAVVEFDPLADAVRARAQDDDLGTRGGRRLVLLFVCGVEVGRVGFELGGAGVHGLEGGHDAVLAAQEPDGVLAGVGQAGDATVGEAHLLGPTKNGGSLRAALAISVSNSTISRMFSRNHGSMRVSAWIASVVRPAR